MRDTTDAGVAEAVGQSNLEYKSEVRAIDAGSDELTFLNPGLANWEAGRSRWLGQPEAGREAKAVNIDVDEIIDLIISNRWRQEESLPGRKAGGGSESFPTPVPLPQMVDLLQDLWEAEGLEF